MHNMEVFCPVTRDLLTKEERSKAVGSLMLLKEKRNHLVRQECAPTDKNREGIGQNTTRHPPPC
jgi:hypothetical protein